MTADAERLYVQLSASAVEAGKAFQRMAIQMERIATVMGRSVRHAMLRVRGPLWSRYTLGERERQRDERRQAKRPPVVWRSD